jgi:hypothetical protein
LGRAAVLSDLLPHLALAFSLTLPLNPADTRRKTSLPLALLFPVAPALMLALERGGFGETAPPRNCRWRCCWRRR